MKTAFYPRLAWDGIRKNRSLYLPHLLACSLAIAVFYILAFLSRLSLLDAMSGGSSTKFVLELGAVVIAVFSAVFLFYTNSFLIRKRKKEFGLYSVLGMSKRNISVVLFYEVLFSFLISYALGIGVGIALSKLAELGLLNLIDAEINYAFSVPFPILRASALYFGAIFLLIYLNTLRQIRFAAAITLVKSEQSGEKPPKANWILGILGILLLGCAYYIAVSIQQPLEALMFFFVAVLLVIFATYLLMIAGSVLLCRILQKKKNFYYQSRHFISVSSMTYRMKRNGAGLASICILLTMVLVMIASSACLYFGKDAAIAARYPRDICITATRYGALQNDTSFTKDLSKAVETVTDQGGISRRNVRNYCEYAISGYLEKSHVTCTLNSLSSLAFINYNKVAEVHFISLDAYNRSMGENETLRDGEAIVCAVKTDDIGDVFSVENVSYHVAKRIDYKALDFDGASLSAVCANVFVIVNDVAQSAKALQHFEDYDGTPMILLRWYYEFDLDDPVQDHQAIADEIEQYTRENVSFTNEIDRVNFYVNSRDGQKGDFLATFGGLFFIGILLSIVFLIAAVLIIYYKQISEGYEDQTRFAIMQKVGITKRGIRQSINAQMRTVFLLPITFAALHLTFAFPMIRKVLMLFGVFNTGLLVTTAGVSALICAAFYLIAYRLTSNVYYKIVSSETNE